MQLKRVKINVDTARTLWGDLSSIAIQSLEDLIRRYWLSIAAGDLLYLDGKWYVTHAGLLANSQSETMYREFMSTRRPLL